MSDETLLHTTPEDPTPDAGPRRHGGLMVVLGAFMATLTALFGAGLAHVGGRPALIVASLVVFGGLALWWWRCAWLHWRDRTPLPRSHSVLAGLLGFDLICTCRGVAPAVFFHPDRAAPGSDLELFVFIENYVSRRRVVEVRVGPHRGLGLDKVAIRRLHLAAGQAAVYRMTVRINPSLPPGSHDLPAVLRVCGPNGVGRRLPGARRALYDIWHTRFAAPFAIEGAPVAVSMSPLPPPAYVSLASVCEPGPRLKDLQQLALPGWLKSSAAKPADLA